MLPSVPPLQCHVRTMVSPGSATSTFAWKLWIMASATVGDRTTAGVGGTEVAVGGRAVVVGVSLGGGDVGVADGDVGVAVAGSGVAVAGWDVGVGVASVSCTKGVASMGCAVSVCSTDVAVAGDPSPQPAMSSVATATMMKAGFSRRLSLTIP